MRVLTAFSNFWIDMYRSNLKHRLPVRHDTSAMFFSHHKVGSFPPQMDATTVRLLTGEEFAAPRGLMVEMTNRMAWSMCPDLHDDARLSRHVTIVASEEVLVQKLPEFMMAVRQSHGLFYNTIAEYGQVKPRILLLGAITGHCLVIRLDALIGYSKYNQSNWFFKLPSSLREALLDDDIPFIGSGI